MKALVGKALVVAGVASSLSVFAADSAARLEAFAGDVLVPRLNTTLLMNGGTAQTDALKKFLLERPANPAELAGKRIAVISADGVEELEITGPITYLKERGAQVDLVSPRRPVLPKSFGVQYPEQRHTHILTVRFMENATWRKIDRFIDEVKVADYDAILIPGGAWNPDTLRGDAPTLKFIKDFADAGKTVSAICHGPLVLVSAGLLKGRTATAYWNVQLDVKNAGAKVEDKPVVIDGQFITSRFPFDLPDFMDAIRIALLK